MKIGKILEDNNLSADENEKSKNISLKGINILIEDIKNEKIYVKKILEESNKKKEGIRTDMKTEDGATYILKYGKIWCIFRKWKLCKWWIENISTLLK